MQYLNLSPHIYIQYVKFEKFLMHRMYNKLLVASIEPTNSYFFCYIADFFITFDLLPVLSFDC